MKIFWKSTSGKPVWIHSYMHRELNTHFDRPCVNQSECRKLKGHIIILLTFVASSAFTTHKATTVLCVCSASVLIVWHNFALPQLSSSICQFGVGFYANNSISFLPSIFILLHFVYLRLKSINVALLQLVIDCNLCGGNQVN